MGVGLGGPDFGYVVEEVVGMRALLEGSGIV